MTTQTANIVICGAGIAGIAAAYQLAVKQKISQVILVDERPPLSLTSDKSTEAYRNWWPGPDDAMIRYMNRSIDLMDRLADETGNVFTMNRRGYLYTTSSPQKVAEFRQMGQQGEAQGAGAFRLHDGVSAGEVYLPSPSHGYPTGLTGADLITDARLIRQHFPYLAEHIVGVLHARRCGWLSGWQLGSVMLEQAKAHGVQLLAGRVVGVEQAGSAVTGVRVETKEGLRTIATRQFVNAGGPLIHRVARLLDVELPIFSELHLKVALEDRRGVIPRNAPFTIYDDEQLIDWSDEERAEFAADEETRWLTERFPAGVHTRVEGHTPESQTVLMLWDYHIQPLEPVFPLPEDPLYPEIVLRGLARPIPGLQVYFQKLPKVYVDGGYYTKTQENRPLIGPLPVQGAYLIGAFSGFGIMAACAGGELLAAYIAGNQVPDYAPAFLLSRYEDTNYQRLLADWGSTGQL